MQSVKTLASQGGEMPDITMCQEDKCPRRNSCYRYTARPDQYWQSYFAKKPCDDYATCREFWDITKRQNDTDLLTDLVKTLVEENKHRKWLDKEDNDRQGN